MMSSDTEIVLWQDAMCRGEFPTAWRISDALLHARCAQERGRLPRHCKNVWDGRPIAGSRVLVRCYRGLGDTIQFIRYAPLLRAVCTEVIVWSQPSLIPLLRYVEGIDTLLPVHDGLPEVKYDVDLEITELPYVFRTTLDNIPAEVPYIRMEPAPLRRRNGRLHVGLIWRAGEWDQSRSIPFSEITRMAELRGIDWHILQREAGNAGWDGKLGVISGGDNPLDDARIMLALDLVITADTMTAHLGGAIGQQTWTLLPFHADWRWLCERSDTPWYPTMRLFRQKEEGRWDVVVDEVIESLTGLLDYQDLEKS